MGAERSEAFVLEAKEVSVGTDLAVDHLECRRPLLGYHAQSDEHDLFRVEFDAEFFFDFTQQTVDDGFLRRRVSLLAKFSVERFETTATERVVEDRRPQVFAADNAVLVTERATGQFASDDGHARRSDAVFGTLTLVVGDDDRIRCDRDRGVLVVGVEEVGDLVPVAQKKRSDFVHRELLGCVR